MRLSGFALAGALALVVSSGAFAMGDTEYTALSARMATTPATMVAYPAGASQTIEFTGVVSGLFSDGGRTGFLLRPLDRQEIIILTLAQPDRDLTVGNTLRVLARPAQTGAILEALAVTPIVAPGIPAPSMQPPAQPAPQIAAQPVVAAHPYAVVSASETSVPVRPVRPVVIAPAAPTTAPEPEQPRAEPAPKAEQPAEPVPAISEMERVYAERIRTINARVPVAEAQTIAHYIIAKGEKYGVDPRLIFALVKQESAFDRRAVSHAGARGLGQLMPSTASGLGVYDSFDIEQNLDGTVRFIKGQLDRFGRVSLALAAYNAGPGRVIRSGYAVPNIAETQHYVQVIWRDYCTYAGLNPATGEPAE